VPSRCERPSFPFSCLSALHNADILNQLRAEGNKINDEILSHVTPLIQKHINPRDTNSN
jgi:hypothetical protein